MESIPFLNLQKFGELSMSGSTGERSEKYMKKKGGRNFFLMVDQYYIIMVQVLKLLIY
jgi:hypothetical protein